jgi:hypothetical protein
MKSTKPLESKNEDELGEILRPHTNEEGFTCSSLLGKILCNCGRDKEIRQIQELIAKARIEGLFKSGEVIPYTTIKGVDYVELRFITDKLEALQTKKDK